MNNLLEAVKRKAGVSLAFVLSCAVFGAVLLIHGLFSAGSLVVPGCLWSLTAIWFLAARFVGGDGEKCVCLTGYAVLAQILGFSLSLM